MSIIRNSRHGKVLTVLLSAGVLLGAWSVTNGWNFEDSKLTKVMEKMDSALKKLRTASRKGALKEAEALPLILEIQQGALASKEEMPEISKKWKAEEKAKMMAGYRKGNIETLRLALDLEEAVIDGKQDVVKTKIEALLDNKKKGHDVYTE